MTKKRTTTTHRNSRSGAKGTDAEAKRNTEGVAFTPERYSPGEAMTDADMAQYYRLREDEVDFLDCYAESKGELKVIQAKTGFTRRKIDSLLARDHIRAEIMELQEVWRLNRKMTAEHAAAKHIKLMQELESDYHKIDDPVERSKMANPRVKASETYLRAAGHFNHGGAEADQQVVINIDLGDSEVEVSKGKETAKVKKVKDD